MSTPPPAASKSSSDKIKLLIALGLFAVAGLLLGWQLLGSGGRAVNSDVETQQQAILEQVGGAKEPPPSPTPPTQPEVHGRGPRTVKK